MCKEVSIPKAVSTAATAMVIGSLSLNVMGFNTVNGRYCCNVAVLMIVHLVKKPLSFNTTSGKYCCNAKLQEMGELMLLSFNTVNGKYCCNKEVDSFTNDKEEEFQYRKR